MSTEAKQKYRDRASREHKRVASVFLPGKRESQKASASRIVPSSLKNRERFYILMKVLPFFFFAKFQNATVSIRQLSNCDRYH